MVGWTTGLIFTGSCRVTHALHAKTLPTSMSQQATLDQHAALMSLLLSWPCSLQGEELIHAEIGKPRDQSCADLQPTTINLQLASNSVGVCRVRRLQHQLNLTKDANLQKMGKKLCDNLEHFFQGVEVCPICTSAQILFYQLVVDAYYTLQ